MEKLGQTDREAGTICPDIGVAELMIIIVSPLQNRWRNNRNCSM